MRFLVVSDLHGDLDSIIEAIDRFEPQALLCCGDWGDPEQVSQTQLVEVAARLPLLTTFGNHDPIEALFRLCNRDGSLVLLAQGEVRDLMGYAVAGIGGIWAKSRRKRYYVSDDDVAQAAARIVQSGPIDVLLTHGCPIGFADLTPTGKRGGQRCFLEANRQIAPRIHLCGHVHVPQQWTLKDGRQILNVGATPEGSVVLIDSDRMGLVARLERFERKEVP
jgi:uncharacterized protein